MFASKCGIFFIFVIIFKNLFEQGVLCFVMLQVEESNRFVAGVAILFNEIQGMGSSKNPFHLCYIMLYF